MAWWRGCKPTSSDNGGQFQATVLTDCWAVSILVLRGDAIKGVLQDPDEPQPPGSDEQVFGAKQ
jgi:hypothetical protein